MIRSALRLLRVASFATAPSDVLAGFLVCASPSDIENIPRIAALCTCSALLYWGGILFNDLRDLSDDAVHRPGRPLPSGEFPVGLARAMLVVAFGVGVAIAWIDGARTGTVATLIVVAATTYSLWWKRTDLGASIGMGACRVLSLGLGIAAAGGPIGTLLARTWWIGAVYFLYIGCLTLVGRSESARSAATGPVAPGWIAAAAPILVLLGIALDPALPQAPGAAAPLVLLAILLARSTVALRGDRSPARFRDWVRTGVLGILLWNGGLLIGTGHVVPGLGLCLLLIPSAWISRYFSPS